MEQRAETLAELAELVLAVDRPHPVRVAIDGCSAAGKTTLADELAQVLRDRTEREVIRVGIDYFKRAVVLRTAYPVDSPEGYYLDTWDNQAIRDRLLIPLGPDGDRRYTAGLMDPSAQNALKTPTAVAAEDAVLLADGAFLQRPELDAYWDLRVYVDITFDEVLRRGIARDQHWMTSPEAAEHRYRTKYIPGERLYVDQIQPHLRAQIVLNNQNPTTPTLTIRRR
ncbi:uridine kinase [Kribbella steppae]|uniref:Uridine kinase n=1 Tax=Kribbella steppae TaxID=2512223 RepID=A0A4R2HUH8_9ACTN|nr:uridine kinase [Kribbella steppae]TCO34248.1 uridine kinase [Kribbella steppae]